MTQITWLGHATFELRFESGEVLVTDPWIEGNPAYPKGYKLKRVDAISLSHAHFDHANDVIPLASQFQPKVVAIFETASWLEKKGVKNTVGINKGGTVDLGFVKLTMTHALHSCSIKDGDQLIYGGEAAGYVLTLKDGRKAYFAGDTAVFSDMALIADLYQPELAFLPIGDHFTMGPEQAALAARLLKVKRIIPMHWGTFPALTGTPEKLTAALQGQDVQVWTLQKGEPAQWSEAASSTSAR
ncbi:MAG TPA: metal-dependent hydrolase [Bryobacteraceae bacterium]|nr:metal-dependent hydrolase [Bryobacteraceae bacterium]HXR76714.1 metal-dependent hydrolase [Bryobacteraceae bacterium]